jgi:hypothetical protein
MDVLLLVYAMVAAIGTQNSVAMRHLPELPALPQTLHYRANYSADFQYLSHPLCDGPVPVLYVTCSGRNLTILNTSDETILCHRLDEPLTENGTSYQCENTCEECQTVYRYTSTLFDPLAGPFGSIFFLCEGDTLDEIDASLVYSGGGTNGTCAAPGAESVRNYHIGRLGISCPVGSMRRNIFYDPNREYVYDDTYFDCVSKGSVTQDIAFAVNDVFACVTGMRCEGPACSFPFWIFGLKRTFPNFMAHVWNPW